MTPAPEWALRPTDVVESDHPDVVALAEGVAGNGDDEVRARRLFEWVRDEIPYDMAPRLTGRSVWRASATMGRGRGFCQQKAVLLTAMGRAVGIPTALSFQDLRDHQLPAVYAERTGGVLTWHGLVEFLLRGTWQRLDPALDRARCERHGFQLVEFDDRPHALLPSRRLDGARHFEILRERGRYADLPEEAVTLLVEQSRWIRERSP